MIKVRFDSGALDAALDKLSDTIKGKVVVSGAAAAAREFYDEARSRVPVKTGKLRNAIYRVLSDANTDSGRAEYHISWNRKKAPHGHLVEFGTSRAPARPFLRPAYDAARGRAFEAAKKRMSESLKSGS